jgi:hypothetical protein
VHSNAGPFDIDLPQTESRNGGEDGNYGIVFNFENSLSSISSSSSSTGTIIGSFIGPSPNQYTVNLTAMPNAQQTTVTLSGVQDEGGNFGNIAAVLRVLVGDTNGDGHVSASDVAHTKSRVGQPVDVTNFRSDVTGNGAINASDADFVKAHVGSASP